MNKKNALPPDHEIANNLSQKDTKFVAITLVALTRCKYSEVIEVPVSMTDDELNELVLDRFENVDGGEFVDDHHHWERGTCEHKAISPEVAAMRGAVKKLNADGLVTAIEKESPAVSPSP